MTKLGSGRLKIGWAWVLGIALLAAPAVLVEAQSGPPNRPAAKFYPDFSDTADALLRNAAGHARDGQWAEAVEIYQRVIEQFGEKVARLPKDDAAADPTGESVLFVDLRQFCQRRLAALPPEALAIYRGRVDAQAERWYRQGAESRDPVALRRVVTQAFCSSWGDDALNLLGDLAFQAGQFDEALSAYRRLVPDRSGEPSVLTYPDPGVDRARVAAKKLLCRAALGDGPDAEALAEFARAYPDAEGALAGRKGPYARALAEALAHDRLNPPDQPDGRWPTFAGAATRTHVVPGPIDVGSLQWRVPLTPVTPGSSPYGRVRSLPPLATIPAERLLAYHPIVLGDQVIVAEEDQVVAYNLNDRPGRPEDGPRSAIQEVWKHDEQQGGSGGARATRPVGSLPRYTLTAYGDRIFARLGPADPSTSTNMSRMMGGNPAPSILVALDRRADGKLLWRKSALDLTLPQQRPAHGLGRGLGFKGTPVADARSVYVALTDRREQTATYVACLDAESGEPRWIRYLGAASSDVENMMNLNMGMGGMMMGGMGGPTYDVGHRLLTLAGPTLYYQTNLGAVAALDADTGAIRWVATYSRQEHNGGGAGRDRDLNPAIIHDGLVIVAPADSNALHAFDAASGRLVWKTKPIPAEVKLAHVLGVARGHVVATGNRVLMFDVKDGKLAHAWPEDGRGFDGYGRGILAGDKIYWPTQNEIHVLEQRTGLRSGPPIRLQEAFRTSGGNLVAGDGYLIVAQSNALVVFCQNSRLIERYREEIAREPDRAAHYYQLAQAVEAIGREDEALAALASAVERAAPADLIDGRPMAEAALDQQFRLLMKLAAKAQSAGAWDEVARRFEAAGQAARSDRDRLAAQLGLADARLKQDRPDAAVALLQRLLLDDRLRSLSVAADDGHRSIRSDLLVTDRLATILGRHGRDLYAEFERAADDLLARGRAEKSPRLLEEIDRSYPVARAVPHALLALGELHAEAARPAEAAAAYKRLLVRAAPDDLRARALLGLARAYEVQRFWVPAREAYEQALARFPDARVDDGPDGATLGGLVADRLSQPPFAAMAARQAAATLPVPLVRRWGRSLGANVRPVAADGVPPSSLASRVFLVQGSTLRPVDADSGSSTWSADLGAAPLWVGYLADKVVAATEAQIVALNPDSGSVLWRHELDPAGSGRTGLSPFAQARARPSDAEAPSAGRFHDVRGVNGRVLGLRGDRELRALDGESGLLDWTYTPAAGAINPRLWAGPRRIVLQTRKPNAIVVLETDTGRLRARYPQADDEEEWARPPLPIDDDRVVLVRDRRTVALFDLNRGVYPWTFRESAELPKNGPPRVLGDGEHLLVVHDGHFLIRLDVATGQRLWARPLGTEDLSERPDAVALDEAHAYWLSGPMLHCGSLDDGAPLWERLLSGPPSGWSVALSAGGVAAYPIPARQSEGELDGLPIAFLRRDSGEPVQRLFFPVAVSDLAVRLLPEGALVATQGGVWGLGSRPAAMDGPDRPR